MLLVVLHVLPLACYILHVLSFCILTMQCPLPRLSPHQFAVEIILTTRMVRRVVLRQVMLLPGRDGDRSSESHVRQGIALTTDRN